MSQVTWARQIFSVANWEKWIFPKNIQKDFEYFETESGKKQKENLFINWLIAIIGIQFKIVKLYA